MNYKNKTVVITGAAKGIGAACARLFYDAGANVALLDMLHQTTNSNDERRLFLVCDVSLEKQVQQAFEEARARPCRRKEVSDSCARTVRSRPSLPRERELPSTPIPFANFPHRSTAAGLPSFGVHVSSMSFRE